MSLAKTLLAVLLGCAMPCALGQSLHKRPAPPVAPAPQPEPPAPQPPSASGAPATVARPASLRLPSGTTMEVEIRRQYPLKAGEPIEGSLLYPLYIDDKLAVPANTPVHGTVVELVPDRATRWHGRLRGDFTPFRVARVKFEQLSLAGESIPIRSAGAVAGAPVLRLQAPGARPHSSLIAREWAVAKSRVHQQIAFFIDPGLGGRAMQLLYHQLPYHPQHIAAHTAWTFDLSEPVDLPQVAATAPPVTTPPAAQPEVWSVHALLTEHLTSATAKPGDPVAALVVEPVYDRSGTLVVPQGSTLIGKVTTAKSARSLGRNGKLRFVFQQVRFPQGLDSLSANRPVQGALSAANAEGNTNLSMDAEGTVTPKSPSSVIAPLLLTMLAGRALDNDGNLTAQTGVASNGFGLVGRFVGMAAGSRNLAAGLGFYAAGLSLYENFLRPGHDVDFPKHTRIEIETTPLRAPVLQPDQP